MSCPGLPPTAKLELHLKIGFLGKKSNSHSFPLAPGLNLLSQSYSLERVAGERKDNFSYLLTKPLDHHGSKIEGLGL